MNEETVVAVFDTADHAAAAVRDLESAGISSSDITQHAGTAAGTAGAAAIHTQPAREQGFWSSLFGGEPEYGHDTAVYERSLQGGSTVVTVRGGGENLDRVLDILERHNPIDIDERAESYGVKHIAGTHQAGLTGTEAGYDSTSAAFGRTSADVSATSEPGTLQLSEETIAVGKRAINRGTTRVRRYVVETPVEEQVNLRDERVTIERRPVTDGRPVSGADFSDKVIEVTETAEEAVVSKQARVREEVVIRKDSTDRTETVRDTVRREDVEITKDGGTATLADASAGTRPGVGGTATQTASAPYKPAV